MKPFHELTHRGKIRRIRKLALQALEHYDLNVQKVTFVSDWTNTIFRVYTSNNTSYMLRICRPKWRTDEDLRSEMMWLQDLHHNTDIGAPEPIATRKGDTLITLSDDGVPEPRRCLITTWLPGKMMVNARLNETNVFKMGALFAQLHKLGLDFQPPKEFTTKKMNSLFKRKENQTFFDATTRKTLTARAQYIVDQATAKVNAAFEKRYANPTGLRVIHNDLHHENINVYRGKLYPYDFEDTVWGYPVQDIATARYDLFLDTNEKTYLPLRDAFRHGYENHSPWPETYPEEIDTFQIGFILWRINDIAKGARPGALDGWVGEVEKFLKTGRVTRS